MRSFGLSNVNVNGSYIDRVWKTRKGGIHEYLTPKRRLYNCEHNIVEKEIRCSCKMFETHGILCLHVIRVMDMNLYEEPPEKYVLRRWRKDIRRKHAVVEVCYHDPAKTERTKRFDKMNAVFDALAFESCGCERTCDIVMKGLKRISDEVRSYNGAHVDEGGGMRGVGDIDSVHSSEPIGSNTQRTAVSGTLHGEQTQASAPPTDNSSVNVVGQSEGSQPSVRIDVVAESGPGEQAATVVCGDPPIPKKKGRLKGTRYKSPGEKGWKKVKENGSKNGGTGGKRKYQGDIAHMMAAASEKMKVTKNTNLSGNLAKAHAEQNVQHTVLHFGVDEDHLLSRNCISWE
ncbi:Protein FAR1-RELATED SEQUENCE 6 [Bienertia sinuspersici]